MILHTHPRIWSFIAIIYQTQGCNFHVFVWILFFTILMLLMLMILLFYSSNTMSNFRQSVCLFGLLGKINKLVVQGLHVVVTEGSIGFVNICLHYVNM